MQYLVVLALVLVGAQLTPEPRPAVHGPVPRYVIWDQHARDVVAADWDAHAHDPVILERAYCLTYRKDVWVVAELVWRVTDAVPAKTWSAGPSSVVYECAPHTATAHVHPAQSCVTDTECVNGGDLSMQCFPSDTDRHTLAASDEPFGVIICDRSAYVAYGPGIG